MIHHTETHFLVPTALLVIASLMDVKTGKFPNWMFLTSLGIAAALVAWQTGGSELMKGLGAAALVFIILTPLVFMKALGAGDIKLLAVFCLLTNIYVTGFVFMYSLFWGLIFGLIKMALAKDLKVFFQSLLLRTPQAKSHKIPYTVAILFGWFSFHILGGLT